MAIQCLLVDDEAPALDLLKKHLSELPEFKIVAACNSAIDASKIE